MRNIPPQSNPPFGIELEYARNAWVGRFTLMASQCEVHIRASDKAFATELIHAAFTEGKRIEQHFSRYIEGNLLYRINHSAGKPIKLDEEYTQLFQYAHTLFEASEGMFDISCGSLRRLWSFNTLDAPENTLPSQSAINNALKHIGLDRLDWQPPFLTLQEGMELDFGGIGKEYAVDKAALIIQQRFHGEYLVNFGGDCYCKGSQASPWTIAVESIAPPFGPQQASNTVTLIEGGVATSGTTKRYFTVGGKRYGHILNPKTARPVDHAPLSVTVVHQSCLSAGALATLAMLEGNSAEQYLLAQELVHWVLR